MTTGFPFMYIAQRNSADYGEVLRHAEWFRQSIENPIRTLETREYDLMRDEPVSSLNVTTKLSVEHCIRIEPALRGEEFPRGPWRTLAALLARD